MPLHTKKNGDYCELDTLTEFERSIITSFEKHLELMFADEWYIDIIFEPVVGEAMETGAYPEYRRAEISVDSPQLLKKPDDVDSFVRHELLHILIWSWFDIAGTLAYKNAEKALAKIEEAVIDRLEHMPAWELMYKGIEREEE
jgi:hypothetical protein